MYIPQVDEFVVFPYNKEDRLGQCVALSKTKAAIIFQRGAQDVTRWFAFDKLAPANIPPAVDMEEETDDR